MSSKKLFGSQIAHQNARTNFRPIDTTFLLDMTVTKVKGPVRARIIRQSKAAAMSGAAGQSLLQREFTADPKGEQFTNIDGLFFAEAGFPFIVMIGGDAIKCEGVFAFTGKISSLVILAEEPTNVTVTAVVRNLSSPI